MGYNSSRICDNMPDKKDMNKFKNIETKNFRNIESIRIEFQLFYLFEYVQVTTIVSQLTDTV